MFLALSILLACTSEPSVNEDSVALVREVDGVLVDPNGREMLLRGMNARVEGLFDVSFDDGRIPLQEIPEFTGEDCRFLAQDLGQNLLRLPVNWSGIEPENDRWDQAYLDRMTALVDACHDVGVYTVVDLHQDAYSKEIGEDGAPLWAIVPAPTELLEGPLDDLAERRTSGQVLAAFASLYADAEGLIDEYAQMAARVAAELDGHPGAIGLELQNEPVALGNQDALDEFHRRVAAAVRDASPTLPLYFEPDSLRNFTDEGVVGEPFPFDNAVYSPHVYTDVFEDGWASEDEGAIEESVAAASSEAALHASALFVGEFGHDPRTERGARFLRTALDAFDAHGASWAGWVYEEWSQDSWGLYDGTEEGGRTALREEAADLFARPFPEAVSGQLVDTTWADGVLTVNFEGGGLHRITRPMRVWPEPPLATCGGEAVQATEAGPGRLEVRCNRSPLVLR